MLEVDSIEISLTEPGSGQSYSETQDALHVIPYNPEPLPPQALRDIAQSVEVSLTPLLNDFVSDEGTTVQVHAVLRRRGFTVAAFDTTAEFRRHLPLRVLLVLSTITI